MAKFLRPVNNSIIYILIDQSEEVRYGYYNLLKSSPYPVSNGEFQRIFGYVFNEFPHRFVCCKPLYHRKNVVLQSNQREVAAICEAKLLA